MSDLVLTAETGREQGSRPSRRLRHSGRVPAVVYGKGSEPIAVSVDQIDLRTALTTEAGINALITLDIEGSKQLSIVKDLQRHPVRRDVLHVDFIRIDAESEVEVEVPLVLTGEAKEVINANGMVDQVMHNVVILAKPADIPVEVFADVTDLEVGSSLRVVDIDMPAGVTPGSDPEATIATGLITRSTKEFLRAEAIAAGELVEEGEEGEEGIEGEEGAEDADDAEGEGDAAAADSES